MHSEPASAPPATPAARTDPPRIDTVPAAPPTPPATSSPRGSAPVRLGRKVMSVLHGDKYMAGAYPPEWQDPATRSKER
jgi:hypothetical protein